MTVALRSAALVGAISLLGHEIPNHFAYLAVGLAIGIESMGIPMPGETALIAASIASKTGDLNIYVVIAAAATGAIIGDNIGYWVGRKGGRRLLEHPGPFYNRRMALLVHGDRFFESHGPKAVFLGRWVALLRVTAAVLAGANRMDAKKFFVWNALGGVTWAVSVGVVGYLLGATGERLIHEVGIWAAVVAGIALVLVLGYVSLRERRALKAEMSEVEHRLETGEPIAEWHDPQEPTSEEEQQ